jgi:hypothetical protein
VFPGAHPSRPAPSRAGRLTIAAAAFTCVAAAAGCASSPSTPAAPASTVTVTASPTAPAATPTATGSTPAAVPACPTSSLQVRLGAANGYAGGTDQPIDFNNTGSTSCTLYGYPGVSLVSGPPYTQIGLAARRGTTTPVKLITLAPGATANAMLQIVDALNYPPSSCSPTKATYLRVYPPNQKAPAYLPAASQGCAKPVQILTVGPVTPGSGSS